MRPLKALIIVLLILTVLLLTPVGVDGGYDGKNLVLAARLGFLNIRILPMRKKPKKLKISKPKKDRKKSADDDAEPKKKKSFDFKEIKKLIPIALKALGRFRRKLRIDYLRIHYVFATDDPFKTAMGFGASSAALSTILPLIDNAFEINERDVGTSFDFSSNKSSYDVWLTMDIRIWEVFYIAIAFGIDYLKLKRKEKREDKQEDTQENEPEEKKKNIKENKRKNRTRKEEPNGKTSNRRPDRGYIEQN